MIDPIRQDQDYHRFADARAFLGLENAADVLSNLPFLVIGAMGLVLLWRSRERSPRFLLPEEARAYWLLFGAVALTGLGSFYYHLAPDDARLVWDRLPIAIAFMALLSAVITERVNAKAGITLLWPLVVIGAASVLYWAAFDDLRAYALVQYGAIAAIFALCVWFPSRYTRGADLLLAVALYAAAKVAEALDAWMYGLGGLVSGHTLKHLMAALAIGWLWRMVYLRRPINLPW
jgi:ceramidase